MTQKINLSIRELLGERGHLDYLNKIIIPQIEAFGKEGKISASTLRKIKDAVKQKGVGILSPQLYCLDQITLNTIEEDGFIFDAILPITDNVSIRNIIKKSSGKEDYKRAVENQRKAREALKGTGYENAVPAPVFSNKRERVIVTPYVSGITFKDSLMLNPDEKEKKLKELIDDYAGLFFQLNTPEARKRADFGEAMVDFNDFFIRNYLGRDMKGMEKIVELFGSEIGKDLNSARKSAIHGDFHGKNVISNGGFTYLDWANAASNGFPEFDISKLITKSDVDADLEQRLVEYAASRLYKTPEEQEESVRRFAKNQIVQELLSAKRYLNRAEKAETSEIRQKLHGMANVWYNSAMRRVRKAVSEGAISESLLEEIVKNPARTKSFSVSEMPDDEFEKLRMKYNPNILMSQEIMQPTTPIAEILQDNPQENIDEIKREMKKSRWKYMVRKIAIPLGAIALAGMLVYGAGKGIKSAKEKQQSEFAYRQNEDLTRTEYSNIFSEAYDNLQKEILDGHIKISQEDPYELVDKIAKENKLDANLLFNMIAVNRFSGGVDRTLAFKHIPHINILDPYAAARPENPILDPLENTQYGAKRLAELIKKNNGNLKSAMVEFYTPIENAGWLYGSLNDDEIKIIKNEARIRAYNSIYGLDSTSDGGLWLIFFKQVPENF